MHIGSVGLKERGFHMSPLRISVSLLIFGLVVGCSDVGFQVVPSKTCVGFNNGRDQTCDFNPNGNNYSVTFKTGQIDILFVNDNSRSMSAEQAKMSNAFSGFVNSLANLDFRIAMVTTDIKKDNGKLIEFTDEQGNASGEKFLKPSSTELVSKFKGTVKRQETLDCESDPTNCPSDDERGIYAANLAITRNEGAWLRNGAHLAIIALADEDQRSGTVFDATTGKWDGINAKFGFQLESKDYPETLVEDLSRLYASKTMSVHSVIVKPGDLSCLNQQTVYLPGSAYPLRGSYGNLYSQLSDPVPNDLTSLGQIVKGSTTSICNSTYYSDLNLVGSLVSANADHHSIQMQCLPDLNDITVEASQSIDYSVDTNTKKILFDNLPFGVEVKVSWVCPNSI